LYVKKKKSGQKSKGFAKVESQPTPARKVAAATAPPPPTTKPTETSEQSFLQSVESGGSSATPVMEEESLSPEERAKNLLRNKYGLKTIEEQQLDAKQLEERKERQRKWAEWKKKADDESFDVMTTLPAPLLIGVDRFLKAGVAVTGLLFITAGLGITLEAWSKTTGNELPTDLDSFIVNTVEPNFTTGLFVLLGFSVSLGIFAALQLGSSGATYKED
jgi:hypothetical protein